MIPSVRNCKSFILVRNLKWMNLIIMVFMFLWKMVRKLTTTQNLKDILSWSIIKWKKMIQLLNNIVFEIVKFKIWKQLILRFSISWLRSFRPCVVISMILMVCNYRVTLHHFKTYILNSKYQNVLVNISNMLEIYLVMITQEL